jgi:hypothetical protein
VFNLRYSWRWQWKAATPYSSERARRFGGTYDHLQGRITCVCRFLALITLPPWRQRRYVPPKRQALSELSGVTVQLTPYRTVHFERLTITHLAPPPERIPVCYATLMFIIVSTLTLQLMCTLSQVNQVEDFQQFFLRISFNVIHIYMPRSSNGLFHSEFRTKISVFLISLSHHSNNWRNLLPACSSRWSKESFGSWVTGAPHHM